MDKEKITEKIQSLFKRSSSLVSEEGEIATKKGWLSFLKKKKGTQIVPLSEIAQGGVLEGEQESNYSSSRYDLGQQYRVMAWNSRLLGMAFCFSALINVGLGCVLFSLFPLKETEHHLVTFKESSEQVVKIESLSKDVQGRDELIKYSCRDYVKSRETIEPILEKERWAEQIRFWSSEEVWSDFWKLMNPEVEGSVTRQYRERKALRLVRIIGSSQVTNEVYLVDWEEIIKTPDAPEQRRLYRSTLRVEMRANNLKAEHTGLNPIGFTVVQYRVDPLERTRS